MTTRRPPRLLAVVVAVVCVAGSAAFAAALASLAGSHLGVETVVGLCLFAAAMILADRFPVPLEGLDAAGISLSFVFGVAAVVLFGWAGGLVAVVTAPAVGQLLDRRPAVRVAYNTAVHGLAAGAAGLLIAPLRGDDVGRLVAQVALCAMAQHLLNTELVSAAVSASSSRPLRDLLLASARATAVPFALMASAALMLVVLWQRSPGLSAALVGPLLAIALYQRSTHRVLRAMRLALTDPLTGLGNHRHFHERLREELQDARRDGGRVALCLADIDDFKLVNDRFGHPAGDRVLAEVAARLRQGGRVVPARRRRVCGPPSAGFGGVGPAGGCFDRRADRRARARGGRLRDGEHRHCDRRPGARRAERPDPPFGRRPLRGEAERQELGRGRGARTGGRSAVGGLAEVAIRAPGDKARGESDGA